MKKDFKFLRHAGFIPASPRSGQCLSSRNKCGMTDWSCGMTCRGGFTLAEVLITLGIIGVVAALVMPGLIANFQEKVVAVQLQKSINVLSNAFQRMMADDEVDSLADTEFAQAVMREGEGYYHPDFAAQMPESTAILRRY